MASRKTAPRFPGVEQFLMGEPLYTMFAFDAPSWDEGLKLFRSEYKLDGHCPPCGRNTTYDCVSGPSYGVDAKMADVRDGYFRISIVCARNEGHEINFWLQKRGNTIQKVGQWPSLADIALDELKEYKALLTAQDAAEFHKAIGLAAHGVGVGSFVYLRRVFTRLIDNVFDENKGAQGWRDEDFHRLRMPERIDHLKAFLPDFVVKNRAVYGILSKGLHELSEQECLAYFRPLKLAILRMLRQAEEQKREQQLDAELAESIAEISRLQGRGASPPDADEQQVEVVERVTVPDGRAVSRAPRPIRPIRR